MLVVGPARSPRVVDRRVIDLSDARVPTSRQRSIAVVGSVIDPATIANDHIRAHALEGRLFRRALERAARAARLPCATLVERSLYDAAGTRLRRRPNALRRTVTRLGAALAGRWCADEKTAALAAWLVLSRAH